MKRILLLLLIVVSFGGTASAQISEQQLAQWLKKFPDADANGDGKLSLDEAIAYRNKLRQKQGRSNTRTQRGAPRTFKVDPGWDKDMFPDHAVCYQSPEKIKDVYAKLLNGNQSPVTSFKKPTDGSLRIVGTGHSFMAPGYRTFPRICAATGMQQKMLLHTGGGMTGSARYKWEQENGIFQFDGKPQPKLLASIANAKWDAMVWGPYFNDRPEYYSCWIDFCLKYNPEMKFYLSDAWPQLYQLGELPQSEKELTAEAFDRMGKQKDDVYAKLVGQLNDSYNDRVFILPTCEAMVLAAKSYLRGELPGIEGLHRSVGKKDRSLWRDQLGHLGPGFDRLEGYVFYATIYGRSPELIKDDIEFGGNGDFPSRQLDRQFRKIAWQAAINNKLSGVSDKNENGIDDKHE